MLASKSECVQDLLDAAITQRDLVATKRKLFQRNLQTILKSRDITPDKLRNASTLKVEIPKFSGYDCSVDFFTFKSEFENLVEPTVQKKYLAEYLKRNFLTGMALTLVEREKDYGRIWEKLHKSYGNARLLLQNKLGELEKLNFLNSGSDEKIANSLAQLLNVMRELEALATEHKIEGQLYEGGGLEKVFGIIGNYRRRKFRTENLETMSKKQEWIELLKILEKELRIRQKMVLDAKSAKVMGIEFERQKDRNDTKPRKWSGVHTGIAELKCHFCDKTDHVIITTARGNNIIPYYVCETFVNMTPEDRFSRLKSRNLCTQCLYPGAKVGSKHKCLFLKFCCPHISHGNTVKPHVLLCGLHKNDAENVKVLAQFKERFIEKCKTTLPLYSKKISCFSHVVGTSTFSGQNLNNFKNYQTEPEIVESAIFQLQTIEVDGIKLNLFFDSGCGDMIIKKSAVEKLAAVGRAKQIISEPITLSGVGGQTSVCKEGVYTVCLPLFSGKNALLTGLCLPKITTEFPTYGLNNVECEIRSECEKRNKNLVPRLPKLPKTVGGDTDILLGSKYRKYLPKSAFKLDTGLEIFESVFVSPCGSRGIVSGPHKDFSETEKIFKGTHVGKVAYNGDFFKNTIEKVRNFSNLSCDAPLLGIKPIPSVHELDEPVCCSKFIPKFVCCNEPVCHESDPERDCEPVHSCCAFSVSGNAYVEPKKEILGLNSSCKKKLRAPKCVKQFDDIERAGTEVSFRCVDCRDCPKCKLGERVEAISIQEEVEQNLIEQNVVVDPDKGVTTCKLPFLVDPDSRLVPNEQVALKVFRQQVKKLNDSPEDKAMVIESQQKLQDLGFVDYVSNLTEEEKLLILDSEVKYFIPWRAVWNEGSVTTGCRMVFDGTQSTKEGCSLNSLLPKGVNGMNKLNEIMIRWSTWKHAFHTDISKMYNMIRLHTAHWKYQLFLWSDNLMPGDLPAWKVIKTAIYGVRPSGNIAECGLRRTAELSRGVYPKAYDVLMYDTYVDDCMSGTDGRERTLEVTDELQATLAKGGFTPKGFAMSGEDPPEKLSNDNQSVLVGGLKWFPKGDFISLNIKDLNFNKRIRGKKSVQNSDTIPDKLTLRHCVGKASEIFDLTGKIAPIIAGLKLDVSVLHQFKLDWDDPIPNELKNIWVKNFDLMKELKTLKFKRAVIPEDSVSLDVETIDTADAGENLVCAAIYARYKRRNGEYSCQLIFARTKIVHNLSIPRAELEAALLNASTGHVVRLSLKEMHKKSWKVSDSHVTLHWINSVKRVLKIWVRSRVIEILRLTDRLNWYYVASNNMIADLGTHKGAKVINVGPDSAWIIGLPWMRLPESKFPIKNLNEISLSESDKNEFNKEKMVSEFSYENMSCLATKYVPNQVGERYKFSCYLVDPNKFRFRTIIRILAMVFLFIHKISRKLNRSFKFLEEFKPNESERNTGVYIVNPIHLPASTSRQNVAVVHISEDILNLARKYYFQKATLEVKQYVDPRRYENNSVMKNGILYYTGRILSSQKIDGKFSLGDACLDLCPSSFIVPVTDAHSPIAYAIVSETHWYHVDVAHGGVESVLRHSQNIAYIIGGRDLVKCIKKMCAKCRILRKRGIQIAMGPLGDNNLKIAPAFYTSQVDICGPFSAYSPVNKRAKLKIYYVVFCCTVTGTVDCRVMESYNTDSFVLAFIRFSCRFGYPKVLLPDEGSQLLKGCQDMVIAFSDLKHKLIVEYGVEYKTCPVGAHNVHGKVERKIQEIKRSLKKCVEKNHLSVLQWETLGQQISNSINNVPIGLGNKCEMLENLDILTPNRLILGRNNGRCPTEPLMIQNDARRIIESNNQIFEAWFKEWLKSYVPTLIKKPKWFKTEKNLCVGDIVLFLKSEQEFDRTYQYGIVTATVESRDGIVRMVEVEYQNPGENVKRRTNRVRELVVIHQIDEISISKELYELARMNDER